MRAQFGLKKLNLSFIRPLSLIGATELPVSRLAKGETLLLNRNFESSPRGRKTFLRVPTHLLRVVNVEV